MMKTQCFVCMFMDIAREVIDTFIVKSVVLKKGKVKCNNSRFMFAGINMSWARFRLILARAARRGLE